MLVLTNFERFAEQWTSHGTCGRALICRTAGEVLRNLPKADLVLLDCDLPLTLKICALYWAMPFLRRPLLVNDIVLRRPRDSAARRKAQVIRLLLRQVNHFTHYFRDIEGYHRLFGIPPERSSYIPFKPNIRYRHAIQVNPEGEYALCFGRSERDYDTFFQAIERCPDIPAAIPQPDFAQFARHSSRFSYALHQLPANVRVLEDDGSAESLVAIIRRARLVVLPIVADRISASGIGTYLNAMLMGKCVIITKGPGVSDLLTGEVLMVDPEDSASLAKAVRRAWDDRAFRESTAEKGRVYAESCGGEPELLQRVLDRAIETLWLPQMRKKIRR